MVKYFVSNSKWRPWLTFCVVDQKKSSVYTHISKPTSRYCTCIEPGYRKQWYISYRSKVLKHLGIVQQYFDISKQFENKHSYEKNCHEMFLYSYNHMHKNFSFDKTKNKIHITYTCKYYYHAFTYIIQVLFRQYILIICFEFCFILLTSFTVTVWFSQKLKNWHKTYSIHVHVYIRIFTKFK